MGEAFSFFLVWHTMLQRNIFFNKSFIIFNCFPFGWCHRGVNTGLRAADQTGFWKITFYLCLRTNRPIPPHLPRWTAAQGRFWNGRTSGRSARGRGACARGVRGPALPCPCSCPGGCELSPDKTVYKNASDLGKPGFALEFPSLPICIFSPFRIPLKLYFMSQNTITKNPGHFPRWSLPVIFSLLCFHILYLSIRVIKFYC